MKSTLIRRIGVAMAGLCLAAAAQVAAIPSAQAASASDIAAVANQEATQPHTCSYYGNCPGGGWCAVFARWVWERAGVSDLTGLDISAVDFYKYGVAKGTVSQVPHVGDAVVYNLNSGGSYADHVNIVVGVSGDTVTTVGGNESNTVQRTTWNWRTGVNAGGQRASAYISPLGLGSAVHEVSALSTGWSDGSVTGASSTEVSAIMWNDSRTVYSVQNGQLHERSAASGWGDGHIPTSAPVSAVSAIVHNGVRLVYVVENGRLHELDGGNGWAEGYIPTSGPVTAVSAISINGIRLVYVVENGVVHEINGGAGWSDSPITTTSSVTEVSAVNHGGSRLLYTIQNGTVHEVNGAAGWSNAQVSPAQATTVSAVIHNGVRLVYAVESDARLHELDGGNGWADGVVMPQRVGTGSVAALSDNGMRRVYTLQ